MLNVQIEAIFIQLFGLLEERHQPAAFGLNFSWIILGHKHQCWSVVLYNSRAAVVSAYWLE